MSPTSTARPFAVEPDSAPNLWQIRNLWRVMATGVQTGGSFCALDQLVTTDGGGPPTHTHTQDEGLYVLSGHCTYHAAGTEISADAGAFVAIPRHTEHSFTVDAPDTRLLNFYLPAGFEMILMGLAVPAERHELPPPEVPMAPRELVEQLSRDYGQTEILGLPFADPPQQDNMDTRPTPGAAVEPFIAHAKSAPAYWFAGAVFSVLADSAATNGSYCLLEQSMRCGPAAGPHRHLIEDEVFYILEGDVEFVLDDQRLMAPVGALVFIPRGTVHAIRVTSSAARALNLYTPAGFERMIQTLGVRTQKRTPPPAEWKPPSPPDPDLQQRARHEAGLRFARLPAPWSGCNSRQPRSAP